MKKIILLITGLIVHSILYAQVHEIQLEIEHRRSVSDVLKSIENRIDKSNSNFKRNEMQDMYSARSAIMEKSLKAIENLNEIRTKGNVKYGSGGKIFRDSESRDS